MGAKHKKRGLKHIHMISEYFALGIRKGFPAISAAPTLTVDIVGIVRFTKAFQGAKRTLQDLGKPQILPGALPGVATMSPTRHSFALE